jgi:hypothetical protein
MDSALATIQFFFRNKRVKKYLKQWNGSTIRRTDLKCTVMCDGGIFISFVPAAYSNCPLLLFSTCDPTIAPDKVVCDLVTKTYQPIKDGYMYTTKLCIRCLAHGLIPYKEIHTNLMPVYERPFPVVNTSLTIHDMASHLHSSLNNLIDMDFAFRSAFSYIDRYSMVYSVNDSNRSAIFCAAVLLAVSMQSEIGHVTVSGFAQLVGCMEWQKLYEYALHIMGTIGWRL